MTTPTGTISMTDIQTEFGGTNPIGLNEYYAGGAYVPSGTSGVPSSGTISMNNLRGKSKVTPYTVTIIPTALTENAWFTITTSSSNPIYSTVYWKIVDYVPMTSSTFDSSDFNVSTGMLYYDTETGQYTSDSFRGNVDTVFDTGKFKVAVYSDAAYTNLLGTSQEALLADYYTASTPTLSRTSIYRYANLDTAYMASVVTLSTSGLEGAALYYEVYTTTAGATLTSADIDSPVALTGSQLVPTGGTVQLTVRATAWNGASYISTDKNIYVRWRLGDANGAIIGTSPVITLYKTPTFSASISPTTIREGYSTTVTVNMLNVPLGACSVFYTTVGSSTASLIDDFIGYTSSSGEIPINANSTQFILQAATDTATESNETLYVTIRLNSTTGTAFWVIGDNPPSNPPLTVQSPAQIVSASADATNVAINNVHAYPYYRVFGVRWRAKPAASQGAVTPYSSTWNTAIYNNTINIAGDNSLPYQTGVTEYIQNPGDNNGVFDFEIEIYNSSYDTYKVTRTSATQTYPVYGLVTRITGTNANGSARQIYLQITSTPAYPEDRNFQVQFAIRAWDSTTWGAWSDLAYPAGTPQKLLVPANATLSSDKLIYAATASAQFDLKFRVVLPWQQLKESNELTDIWLG